MVDAIWADLGLRFPPKVVRLPRQARATVADATRLVIHLSDTTSSCGMINRPDERPSIHRPQLLHHIRGDDMTKIDIDRLSEAELVDLHHRIVERLRFLEQMRAHASMLEFSIGDRVCVNSLAIMTP
jgi:hypothetical protein